MRRGARAAEVARRLAALYPDAGCELRHCSPFELLVATILSAQCTDKRVNEVTPVLFARCRSVADFAGIPQPELEAIVRPTGLFRNKSKNLRALAARLIAGHGGRVPATLDALAALPGVGRKTANVVLGNAFGRDEGFVVDTHIGRLARRLGLSKHDDPVKVENDLVAVFPRDEWTPLSHRLIRHGRRRCRARGPDCPGCELRDICPSARVPRAKTFALRARAAKV